MAQDTRIDHAQRKHDHLRIVLEEEAAVAVVVTGFERYRLVHCALPKLDLAEIDASTSFLGRTLRGGRVGVRGPRAAGSTDRRAAPEHVLLRRG